MVEKALWVGYGRDTNAWERQWCGFRKDHGRIVSAQLRNEDEATQRRDGGCRPRWEKREMFK